MLPKAKVRKRWGGASNQWTEGPRNKIEDLKRWASTPLRLNGNILIMGSRLGSRATGRNPEEVGPDHREEDKGEAKRVYGSCS